MQNEQTYKQRLISLYNEWCKVESTMEWNKWADRVRKTTFGTYGTIPLVDVVKNTELRFPSSWVKDSFLNECNDAILGIKL